MKEEKPKKRKIEYRFNPNKDNRKEFRYEGDESWQYHKDGHEEEPQDESQEESEE